ncbi:hypothetical protein IMZ48_11300 [Candidatus Bathyarchaeota archaeon]|nr:hypothetical protein [Candidatus Bathyarchaeota archaeon]
MVYIELPELPAPHAGVVDYIADNPGKSMSELMAPYREYENKLRTVFAQEPGDPRLLDGHINVLPLFNEKTARITTRARDLASESQAEQERYIMALPDDKRRSHGSPATVGSLKDFRSQFAIFSENSLSDLDWSNVRSPFCSDSDICELTRCQVVAAGSSVVNCLLPVPEEYNTSKRKLREYYHQKFCPASDVDLFLYGLNEEQAIEKIKQIELAVRDACSPPLRLGGGSGC